MPLPLPVRTSSPDQHEGSDSSLDEGCTLMRAMADTVIFRQDNPAAPSHLPEPFLITRILGEMVIMQMDLCPCLPESMGHDVLPETAIEAQDERVYAALVWSSHRMASSISQGERS